MLIQMITIKIHGFDLEQFIESVFFELLRDIRIKLESVEAD